MKAIPPARPFPGFLNRPLGVALVCLVLSLGVYAQTLNLTFFYDDLGWLRLSMPEWDAHWRDLLKPNGAGFWRPLVHLSFFVLVRLVDIQPFAYHFLCLLIHAAVAGLTFAAGRRILGLAAGWAWAAALLVTVHTGAFASCSALSNACDSYLAMGVLAVWLLWDAWLRCPREESNPNPRRCQWIFAALAAAVFFCILGKESAVMAAPVMFLWAVSVPRRPRGTWTRLFALAAILFFYGLYFQRMQGLVADSYSSGGRVSFSPKAVSRQFADYAISCFIPYIHILEWPFHHIALPHAALWALRLGVWTGLAAAGVIFLRRRAARPILAPLFMGMLFLPLPSLLSEPPHGRFIYAALPFTMLFLAGAAARIEKPRLRKAAGTALGALGILYLLGHFASASIAGHCRAALEVGNFVKEVERVAPGWAPGSEVAIFNHPHPGPRQFLWGYGFGLFEIHLPEKQIRLALDGFTLDTRYAYKYQDGSLFPVAIPTPVPTPVPSPTPLTPPKPMPMPTPAPPDAPAE